MNADQELSPPVTGLVAGKYELTRLLGRGGMGSVWEARHASLGTRFAIKFIDAEYAHSQEARSRFDNEARAAAAIHSKHAIQIFDHGVTDNGHPYIVMEFLVGEALDRRIERLGRLGIQETARILHHVCRGLQKAHEQGIVHRDLKPENIFLVRSPDEDEEVAKVLDFGIAKIKGPPGQQQGVSSSTKTGAVLGTPYFMSPEQARGLRAVDHRADIWSLGVIAFKCVTGTLPFEGESVGDLLVKICTQAPPAPSSVTSGLPPGFDGWFFRALEREPDRRFQTALELAEALLATIGVSARLPPSSGGTPPPYYPSAAGPYTTPGPHGAQAQPAPDPRWSSAPRAVSAIPATTPSGAPRSALPRAAPGDGSAGVTSAPFTASAPRSARSSTGKVLVSVGAAVVGLTAGTAGILVVANSGRLSSARATPSASVDLRAAESDAAIAAAPTESAGAKAPASETADKPPPAPPPPSAPATTATSTPTGRPTVPVKTAPTATTKPPPSATTSAPPASTPTVVKPPPPPPTKTAEPGY